MPKKKLKQVAQALVIIAMFFAAPLLFAQDYQDQRKALSLHYYRGVVDFEAARYETAFAEFQAVASVDPYYKDTRRYLDSCVQILDKTRKDIFRGKDDIKNDSTDLYFLGKSYYEKGDYRRALEAFKVVLTKNPEDKFAQYYSQLCTQAMPGGAPKARKSPEEALGDNVHDMEKEIAYVKADVKEQQDEEAFLQTKAERKAAREDLIRRKEKQLKEQEALLEEEREDYLAQAEISKKSEKLKKEAEKWKNMKERLASKQPGLEAELTEFPIYKDKAEKYYAAMKEALRQSRWNSAGLNAIQASIHYCDSMLIYFYNVKSATPNHENINRLIMQYVKRSDVDENVFHMRSILNLKRLVEADDRPITRTEALFLSQHAEKIAEWCNSMFPK